MRGAAVVKPLFQRAFAGQDVLAKTGLSGAAMMGDTRMTNTTAEAKAGDAGRTVVVVNAVAAQFLTGRVPDWVDLRAFASAEQLMELAPLADIGWFDLLRPEKMPPAIMAGTRLRWLNSIYAGVDSFPLDVLAQRGVVLTNGTGINAITIAEYVVMGMLTIAKGYREVVHAQDRQEWLLDSPGKRELHGSRALILGAGEIGGRVSRMLAGFDVDVTTVRRSPAPGCIGPDAWRARLGEFDWVILAVPATPDTQGMIGADEVAAMKPTAVLINIARGSVIDQDAVIAAPSFPALSAAITAA